MVRAVYRFHVNYHVRRVLKRLQVPLPHKASFNTSDNPYMSSECFKICEDYGVSNDPVKYCELITVVLPGLMITLAQTL